MYIQQSNTKLSLLIAARQHDLCYGRQFFVCALVGYVDFDYHMPCVLYTVHLLGTYESLSSVDRRTSVVDPLGFKPARNGSLTGWYGGVKQKLQIRSETAVTPYERKYFLPLTAHELLVLLQLIDRVQLARSKHVQMGCQLLYLLCGDQAEGNLCKFIYRVQLARSKHERITSCYTSCTELQPGGGMYRSCTAHVAPCRNVCSSCSSYSQLTLGNCVQMAYRVSSILAQALETCADEFRTHPPVLLIVHAGKTCAAHVAPYSSPVNYPRKELRTRTSSRQTDRTDHSHLVIYKQQTFKGRHVRGIV